jgi:hypothetical protein
VNKLNGMGRLSTSRRLRQFRKPFDAASVETIEPEQATPD